MEFALNVVALGFGGVLLTLFALYGIIYFFGGVINRLDRKPVSRSSGPIKSHQNGIMPGTGVTPRQAAVIASAVYSYLQKERGSSYRLTVLAGEHSAVVAQNKWAIEGRRRLMEGQERLVLQRRKRSIEKI